MCRALLGILGLQEEPQGPATRDQGWAPKIRRLHPVETSPSWEGNVTKARGSLGTQSSEFWVHVRAPGLLRTQGFGEGCGPAMQSLILP